MLKTFRVKNYRCLRDVCLDLAPLTVLIGPNDSGKSSLLHALTMLAYLQLRALHEIEDEGFLLSEMISRGGEAEPEMEMEVTCDDLASAGGTASYRLRLGLGQNEQATIREEEITAAGRRLLKNAAGEITFSRDGQAAPVTGSPEDKDWAFGARGLLPAGAEPLGQLLQAIGSIRILTLNPASLAAAARFQGGGVPEVGAEGQGLASLIGHCLDSDHPQFDAILTELRRLAPLVDGVHLKPLQLSQGRGPAKALAFSLRDGTEVPASQTADGVLLLLGFLALLHSPVRPLILLIETPENGIHPGRIGTLMEAFRKVSQGRLETNPVQVVLTTHSPIVLDHARPEEVRVVTRSAERGTRVTRLTDLKNLEELLKDFTLGEIWTQLGEEQLVGEQAP